MGGNLLSEAILPKRLKANEFELSAQACLRLDTLPWFW